MTLAQLRAQSWYPGVAATMNRAGVPEWDWASVVMAESDGNQYAQAHEANGTLSSGLFQINSIHDVNGFDPTTAASWAAPRLAQAYKAAGGAQASPQQVLAADEKAGWPGNDAKLDRKQWSKRWGAMSSILAQEGNSAPSQGLSNGPLAQPLSNNSTANVSSDTTPIGSGNPITDYFNQVGLGAQRLGSATGNGLQSMIGGLEQNLFIGGLIFAIIAGGFVLLASGE